MPGTTIIITITINKKQHAWNHLTEERYKTVKKADIVFYSQNGPLRCQLASGYISETRLLFERENILAQIHAKGDLKFYDGNEKLLAEISLPREEDGKGVYEEVILRREEKALVLDFPIYEWIDHYPNCDGEHDRWSTRTVGCHTVVFDPATCVALVRDE